jgi:glycosyltransferase involved in cell wall biosynthesis
MNMKKISIIMPVYNESESIYQIIKQIRAHIYDDKYEIIIVDG